MPSYVGLIENFGLPVPVVIRAARSQLAADGYGGVELHVRGIVDTGASRCAISRHVVDELGLVNGSWETMLTVAGPYLSPVFEIDLFLILNWDAEPEPTADLAGRELLVGEDASNPAEYDVIIGLDVLKQFTLSVFGPSGRFRLSRP